MRICEFPVVEDPDRPGWLLYRREDFEIDRWLNWREKRFWSRLIASQIIVGSILWLLFFGR